MNHILKSSDLERDRFLELLASLDRSANTDSPLRVWLETPDGWALDDWLGPKADLLWYAAARLPQKVPASEILPLSSAGRIFAPGGEVRWRLIPVSNTSTVRTVFLGHEDWAGDFLEDRSSLLENLSPHFENVFLWGQQTENTPGEWIELRIPHRFRYPVEGSPRNVIARVQLWVDPSGQIQFSRLCNLLPHQES